MKSPDWLARTTWSVATILLAVFVGSDVTSGQKQAGGAGDTNVVRPYFPVEPRELYAGAAMDRATRLWLKYSYRAATHGDLLSSIEQLQIATNTLVQRRNDDFELWDNLAELYCAQANREPDAKRAAAARANGLAMLSEFRCAAKIFSGSQYNMSCKTARGVIPNPAFTPLCYQLFCTEGERDKGEVFAPVTEDEHDDPPDPYALYLAKFHEDAANLPQIEKVCRAPGKK